MKNKQEVQICFDEDESLVEKLEGFFIGVDTIQIDENPIFSDKVAYGDLIKVKRRKDIYYYIETIKKSELAKLSWVLSKEIIESEKIEQLMNKIYENGGRAERVFGGILVINILKQDEDAITYELNEIVKNKLK